MRGWRQADIKTADGLQPLTVAECLEGKQWAFHVGLQQQRATGLLLPELRAVIRQFSGAVAQADVQAGDPFAWFYHQWERSLFGQHAARSQHLEPRAGQAHAL